MYDRSLPTVHASWAMTDAAAKALSSGLSSKTEGTTGRNAAEEQVGKTRRLPAVSDRGPGLIEDASTAAS